MFLRMERCSGIPKVVSSSATATVNLHYASEYIGRALRDIPRSRSETCALLGGAGGVQAVATVVAEKNGILKLSEDIMFNFKKGFKACAATKWDELMMGRAGYVSAIHWMNSQLEMQSIEMAEWAPVCQQMLDNGRLHVRHQQLDIPLMYQYHGIEYLGAAHGLSGILQVMLMDPGWLSTANKSDEQDVWRAVDWLVGQQDDDGGFPTALDSAARGDRKLLHWCHGPGGIIHLLLQAHLRRPEERYLAAARRSADAIWQRGLLRKGPGICHGVAGSGLAQLVMYRHTKEQRYLHRAARMAEFLDDKSFLSVARVPDRQYSLFEGLAGTVCFLCDLLEPDLASFPFMELHA